MNKIEKLMKAIVLKQQLAALQDEFKETMKEETSDSKLKKLMDIDLRLQSLTMQIVKLVASGTGDDNDEMEDFKIEK